MKKINIEWFCRNLGNEVVKAIYKRCYELDCTHVEIIKGKYGKFAIINMYCEDGCICENEVVAV